MRTVFPNRQCCHVWASRTQAHGRGHSIFFEGDTIYSYGRHFPMARHVDNGRGESCVLLTTRGYSPTTAKHKSYVWQAVHHLTTFEVDDVTSSDHAANLARFAELRDEHIAKSKRARLNGEYWLRCATDDINDANDYARFFGLPDRLEMPSDIDAHFAAIKERERVERARRRAADAEREERERIEREEAERELAKELADWQVGKRDRAPWHGRGPALLRIRGNKIETSQGAEVPVSVAPMFWQMVLGVRERGETYTPESESAYKLGHFSLREIAANGDVTIGCHVIEFAELNRIAGLLKLETVTL